MGRRAGGGQGEGRCGEEGAPACPIAVIFLEAHRLGGAGRGKQLERAGRLVLLASGQ